MMVSRTMMTALPSEPRHRFTGDDVARMVEAGVLDEDARVELIGGELFEMSPQGPAHFTIIQLLHAALRDAQAGHIRPQGPLNCGPHDWPEPDIAVMPGALTAFLDRHPRGDEALLVIEVAHSSQQRDLAKAAIYARAGVPEYWLIDLPARRLVQHRQPDRDGYRLVQVLADDESVTALDRSWPVADFLPPA